MATQLDKDGRSPLHHAAAQADEPAVTALIEAGADVRVADRNGWTPLHFAAQASAVGAARALLEAGAPVDARDKHGNTPLWRAVFASRGEGAMIRLLRASGADPGSENAHGVSPRKLAPSIGNYDGRQHFMDLEADEGQRAV